MDVNEFLIDKQEEKIYYANVQHSNEQIQEQIISFLRELYERRRDDYEEEGLQASMIIMPNAFAAKVTEKDGKYPHGITNINLLRYIKGEKNYYIRDAGQYNAIVKNENNEISRNGIEIRITDSKEFLNVPILSLSNIQTRFQLNVLEKLIDELWRVKQNNLYEYFEAGFSSPTSDINVEEFSDNKYKELKMAIENEKKELEKRKQLDEER